MKNQNSRKDILQSRTQILNNIERSTAANKKARLRALGHIPLEDARKEGFKKVGFDVFQRTADIDAGHIWSVEEIDGEKWLVCYTDKNEQIIRNLAKAVKNTQLQKIASEKTAAGNRIITPGDLAEIQPHTTESINFKYRGYRGYVTAAMPDRSQLTFDDGNSLWVENKDLAVIRDSHELGLGDTVRMFSRKNVQGKVIKFSRDNKAVYFENSIGQKFTARLGEVVKWIKTAQGAGGGFAIQNIWIDPNNPESSKLLREYMKGQVMQQQQMGQQGMPTDTLPEISAGGELEKTPPAIKAKPTQNEINSGAAVPAKDLFNTPTEFAAAANINSDTVGFIKHGRTLNIGDMVQKKSTGQTGYIVDINFDRKLGKFYLINYGNAEPSIEYDTDIQKMRPNKPQETLPPGPQDYTRIRETGPGLQHKSKIDQRLLPIKEAATDFVNSFLAQTRADHEAQFPSEKISQTLEQNIVKQAIETYMTKYLPDEYQQVLSAEDKNALSKEVFQTVASEFAPTIPEENIPTTKDFIPTQPAETKPDIWDLEQNRTNSLLERTAAKVTGELQKHQIIAVLKPAEIPVLRDKQRFVQQAASTMWRRGVPKQIAQLIASQLTSFKTPNVALLAHSINGLGFGAHTEEIFKTAADALTFTTFTSIQGKKYALDLPGMETLRGGGGGYPGGTNTEPMKWDVKNPDKEQSTDNAALEQALNENLEDQSKPLEEAAPKINIELDPENKQIVIDYGEEKAIELEPNSPDQSKENVSPNMPQPGGATGPQPGQTTNPGAGSNAPSGQGFEDTNIPVNF
jgi:hypothetical protein